MAQLIYDVLKKDHETVKGLLSQLVALPADTDAEAREELINEIRNELVPHARAEEAVFYNSLRQIEGAKDVVMHGYEEHVMAETLLRTLQVADKIDAGWRQTAKKLQSALEHHIEEEEGKIFDTARQVLIDEEARLMAQAFEQMKPEIREGGFMQNTIDMVANMMPTRFAATLRGFTSRPS